MILQALVDYYDRKTLDVDSSLASSGFEQKEIPFLIVLDEDGCLVQVEDTRTIDGTKKRARVFLVPQGIKKTSGVEANFLWDSAEYVLGVEGVKFREKLARETDKEKQRKIIDRLSQQHAAYKARLTELPIVDAGLEAIQTFLSTGPLQQLAASPLWEEILDSNPVMTFRLISDQYPVCQRPAIVAALQGEVPKGQAATAFCLVTG